MKKYFAVARITFSNILRYRFEFFTIQLRSVITLTTLYFLYLAAFGSKQFLFGYSREEIISYVFVASFVRSFAHMTSTNEMATEILGNSKFFSYLLKPVGYLSYWFALDMVGKIFNTLIFSFVFVLFIYILHINIIIAGLTNLLLFLVGVFVALLLFFYISTTVSLLSFWNNTVWGVQFLLFITIEFASGLYFPITVLPLPIQKIVLLTPFPYLLYFPVQTLLGKISIFDSIVSIFIAALWTLLLCFTARVAFTRGLRRYEAFGG